MTAGMPGRPWLSGLTALACELDTLLRENRPPGVTDGNLLDVQALVVAEEAGEMVGAYRRQAGKARRTGTMRELEDEAADVIIATAVFAARAGIDLDEAVARKLEVIRCRGWRDIKNDHEKVSAEDQGDRLSPELAWNRMRQAIQADRPPLFCAASKDPGERDAVLAQMSSYLARHGARVFLAAQDPAGPGLPELTAITEALRAPCTPESPVVLHVPDLGSPGSAVARYVWESRRTGRCLIGGVVPDCPRERRCVADSAAVTVDGSWRDLGGEWRR